MKQGAWLETLRIMKLTRKHPIFKESRGRGSFVLFWNGNPVSLGDLRAEERKFKDFVILSWLNTSKFRKQ